LSQGGPPIRPVTRRQAGRALLILTLVYTFSFLDRQILGILAEPIKNELHLRDWQVGALTGLAFALFYSTLSLPVARYADRAHRPRLIAAALAIWSLFTAAGALCSTFAQLAVARFGVGLGEAGCTPPSHALIADYYPLEKRAGAIGIYAMGISFGSLLGMVVGGLVLDALGWRAAFAVVGLPGLLLAVFVVVLLREVRPPVAGTTARGSSPFLSAARQLWGKRTFRWISLAAALSGFMTYSQGAFTASFFFRRHAEGLAALAAQTHRLTGLTLGTAGFLGVSLGLAMGVAGAAGTFCGGRLTDWRARRDVRAYLIVPATTLLIAIPIFVTALATRDTLPALLLFALANFCVSLGYPAVYGSVQVLVTTDTRATASALLLFSINLIGLGLGPLTTGALSDLLMIRGLDKADALRFALIAACAAGAISAAAFLVACRWYRADTVE
jgi:MFS family permease